VLVAESLYMLGEVARERGELAAAQGYHQGAFEMRERHAPGGLPVAASLDSLVVLALERGDLARASALAQRSLAIVERLAPGSKAEATASAALARIYLRSGEPQQSVASYRRAVDALEAQQQTFGGIESDRTVFRSRYMGIYRELVGLLVQLGKFEEAFDLLERSRARGMLALLAERDLIFRADLPAELDRRRRLLAAEYDRKQEQLSALSVATEGEQIESLHVELQRLRRQQGELREEIKRRSPRLEALQHPEPLALTGLGRTLDAGTTVLNYSVAESETLLFVTDSDGELNVSTLAIGEAELRDAVERFRGSIARSRTDATGDEELGRLGTSLYQLLVAPAAHALEDAERILIVPDGPLHGLPFAALVRAEPESKSADSPSFLVEWKPLHVVVSLTVYAELKRTQSARRGEITLLAFGDPTYPSGAEGADTTNEDLLRGLPARGGTLPPLPSSRDEVATVTALFGDAGIALLGDQATEERAKAIGTGPRFIHFATHGLIDERFPLDSAIVLSLPERVEYGQDNGVLQAWEIFESMRLDAELVTLSACNTALGAETVGEGIVGLTRAFHYAGSRSVLASLWSVTDGSTAMLMRRFYTYLKQGQTKDEALRAAQRDMIHGKAGPAPATTSTERGVKRLARSGADSNQRYASPYYWAAFTLSGDWR
jgi:CHAT domain-containing protein